MYLMFNGSILNTFNVNYWLLMASIRQKNNGHLPSRPDGKGVGLLG